MYICMYMCLRKQMPAQLYIIINKGIKSSNKSTCKLKQRKKQLEKNEIFPK